MNLAKISTNGQVTIPIEIRRKLKLKSGDKILFLERDNGEIVLSNASLSALLRAQKAFPSIDDLDFIKAPEADLGSVTINDIKDQPILNAAIAADVDLQGGPTEPVR